MGKELTQFVVESKRNPWINNEIPWKLRWKYLRQAEFLSPKDREFKHRLWIGKLWTGVNRVSTLYPDYICPVCLFAEDGRNHPIELECKYTKKLFKWFRRTWKHWTGRKITKEEWIYDWPSNSENYCNQLDFAMTSLKKKIWYITQKQSLKIQFKENQYFGVHGWQIFNGHSKQYQRNSSNIQQCIKSGI